MEDKLIENLRKCPRFHSCSRNLCPLDFELAERSGSEGDKCRWMRNRTPGSRLFKNKLPDELLKYVPKENVERLNETSRKRWLEIKEENRIQEINK